MADMSNWYQSKSLIVQDLVDIICKKTCFVVDQHDIDGFLVILASYDISTAKQFLDSFFAEYEGDEGVVLEQFVKDWCALAKGCLPRKLLKQRSPEQLWQEMIQFDFDKTVFNGNTYFFKKHF